MPIKKRPALKASPLYASEADSVAIDCTGMPLRPLLTKAIENDMQEVVLRVSQFDLALNPTGFQAIVRFNNATRPWAVAVSSDPLQAIMSAIWQASKMSAPSTQKREFNVPSQNAAGSLRGDVKRGIKPRPRKA